MYINGVGRTVKQEEGSHETISHKLMSLTFGSTQTIFRSLLFLKSNPEELSAITCTTNMHIHIRKVANSAANIDRDFFEAKLQPIDKRLLMYVA